MAEQIKKLIGLASLAGKQSISMQRRLLLYLFSMAAAVFAAIMLMLSIAGVFSNTHNELQHSLAIQLDNAEASIAAQMDSLAAQSLSLSDRITREIKKKLPRGSISQLNDNPELIYHVQSSLYGILDTTLQVSDCSGVFAVFDATTNTGADIASSSRAGMYLRFVNLSSKMAPNKEVVYFRGMPEIAREEDLFLHNRWNLEFDIDKITGFRELLSAPVDRLADSCRWTEKLRLPGTWEDTILLRVPVLDGSGKPAGICGAEISALYFRFSYPCINSQFGPMITVLAPLEDGKLMLSSGLSGGVEGAYLDCSEDLSVEEGRYFSTYSANGTSYVGTHRTLPARLNSGEQWAAAILVPRQSYMEYSDSRQSVWIWGSLAMLLALLALSVLFSHRFVKPIVASLAAIVSEAPVPGNGSGISEIEALIAFVKSKEQNYTLAKETLPPHIAELFDDFAARIASLTPSEMKILQYYIDGHEISEIPDLAYISIKTVRKHNSSIYEKLNVASRDELMVYIDLFRRCGRLGDLENGRQK